MASPIKGKNFFQQYQNAIKTTYKVMSYMDCYAYTTIRGLQIHEIVLKGHIKRDIKYSKVPKILQKSHLRTQKIYDKSNAIKTKSITFL